MTKQADYRKMTAQELVDFVAVHLFTQGRQAVDESDGDQCQYRTSDGLKCAAGAVLPDKYWDPDYNNNAWVGYLELSKKKPKRDADKHFQLITALQVAHDEIDNWRQTAFMREALMSVYETFNLNPAILDTLSFADR